MTLDFQNADHVAGGATFIQSPCEIHGVYPEPPIATQSAQTTGDGTTTLRARYTGGRVRIFDRVLDIIGAEVAVATQTGSQLDYGGATLSSGNAIWFALVAVQHRNTGAISLVWVPGAIAAVASVVVPTYDEILEYLGLDDEQAYLAVCGDVRFYRSADTTILCRTNYDRRPAHVDTAKKTSAGDTVQATADGGEEEWGGIIEIPITLASAFALTAGDLYQAFPLPSVPYGGKIVSWEYGSLVSGAGAGADMTLKLQIDGTVVTGSDTQLLLATTAVSATGGRVAGGTITAANLFKPGQVLGVEVDAKPTAFTAGSGILRIYWRKFVAPRT